MAPQQIRKQNNDLFLLSPTYPYNMLVVLKLLGVHKNHSRCVENVKIMTDPNPRFKSQSLHNKKHPKRSGCTCDPYVTVIIILGEASTFYSLEFECNNLTLNLTSQFTKGFHIKDLI